ncbi:PilZ domain-containing protein [Fulvimarina manganoxydans]|uniref:PilZ domain-containing protein n=1 Tax=Fulvimarina manganoxydans TaxID=937218 RepID=A0A1W2EU14_9HYPH|nr:PilZ domain-containing protein [Fulvimarina manganoxydans]SMD13151.1 PilZ domain-containing protein [Fulvimarina manganoxydans]
MASIKHEAEVQRQYPRYRLPIDAIVNGVAYKVLDWSMGGFAIARGGALFPGEIVQANLVIPFLSYDLNVKLKAQVRYVDAETQRAGFSFVELDEQQASILRYLSDAILSGEIVCVGDVIDVSRRAGSGRSRSVPPPPSGAWHRVATYGRRFGAACGVLAIFGALTVYLWANIYDRLYMVRAEAANVSAKVVNLASPSVGRIGYLNDAREVRLGEPLMTVTPAVGDPITVQSPCDCWQVEQVFAGGDFVKTGDTVIKLMRTNAPIVVSALVPAEQLISLYGVENARIEYADGTRVEKAQILWLPGREDGRSDLPRAESTVVLDPERHLSANMMGQPVKVTFDLFEDSRIGQFMASMAEPFTAVAGTLDVEQEPKVEGGVR